MLLSPVPDTHAHVDPDGLYYFFHSPGPKGFGSAITGYTNTQFDQLTEQATTLDVAARKPVLNQAERIFASEPPIVVFWYPEENYAFRAAGYAVDTEICLGHPLEQIVATAWRKEADLIVLGAENRSALGRRFLGCVSGCVLAHAPCSVLVIKLPKGGGTAPRPHVELTVPVS